METTTPNQHWQKVQEIELVYRSKVKPSERPCIRTSADAYQLMLNLWNPDSIELQ